MLSYVMLCYDADGIEMGLGLRMPHLLEEKMRSGLGGLKWAWLAYYGSMHG